MYVSYSWNIWKHTKFIENKLFYFRKPNPIQIWYFIDWEFDVFTSLANVFSSVYFFFCPAFNTYDNFKKYTVSLP